MPTVLHPDTTRGRRTYIVLVLYLAGGRYYLSTDTFNVPTEDGKSLQVWDAIDQVDWDATLDLFGDSPQAVSVPFEVRIPGVDIPSLIAQGVDLSASKGELSRWVEGTVWEDRQVLVFGDIMEPSHGSKDEPIRFSLVQAPFEDRSSMVDPDMVVDRRAWPLADERAYGELYPQIIGSPGLRDDGPRVAGSPGHVVQVGENPLQSQNPRPTYLLIASHEVNATSVWVKNTDKDDGWTSRGVQHVRDGRGRLVAVCTLPWGETPASYRTGTPSTEGDTYMVSWPEEGGQYSRRRDDCLTLAGDVLTSYLARTTLRVDVGRTEAAGVLLNGYRLSGYADEDVSVWEWLRSNVLPVLPISIVVGPEGLYPVVWPWAANQRDAIHHLNIDKLDGVRDADVEYSPVSDVANEVRVAYGLDLETGVYSRQIRTTGDDDYKSATFDEVLFPFDVLRASRSRYGLASHTLETDLVYDSVTAAKTAYWISYAKGVTTRTCAYIVAGTYRWLVLGDVVTITDSEIGWVDQLVWIESIEDQDGDQLRLTVRTIETPTNPPPRSG